MFMLENLKKRVNLIDSAKASLSHDKYITLILNEDFSSKGAIERDRSEKYINIFNSCDITFVGANHGNVMGPFFGLVKGDDEESATLKVYLTLYTEDNAMQIQNELTMLAVATSVYYPTIRKILMPAIIDEFSNAECSFKCENNGSLILIWNKNTY